MYGATWNGKKASRDKLDGDRDMRTKLPLDGWTPQLVGAELVEAIRWTEKAAGATLLSRTALMPGTTFPDPDPSIENWSALRECEVFERRARALSSRRVEQLERILHWPATYLHDKPHEAGVLYVWIRCKVRRFAKFHDACERMGWARATAMRAVDRALTTIAKGLAEDNVRRDGV